MNAADKNKDGMISVTEVEGLLKNIGADNQLTSDEIASVLKQFNDDDDEEIPVAKVQDLFIPPKST